MQIPEVRYTYDHQRPACGVDVAVFWWDKVHNKLFLATITRGKEPFVDHLALPGGHIDPGDDGFGEPVLDAGCREVLEETGIVVIPERMTFVGFYDEPGRDPRGWRITFLYYHLFDGAEPPTITAGDDAKTADWIDLGEFAILENDWSFDHAKLVIHAWQDLYFHNPDSGFPKPKG